MCVRADTTDCSIAGPVKAAIAANYNIQKGLGLGLDP